MTATPPPSPTLHAPGRTTADLLDFLDFACRAGLLTQPTAASYRLGARRILASLPERSTADLTRLSVPDAIHVFTTCGGADGLTEGTRRHYAASFRNAMILFRDYLANPGRWHAKAGQNLSAPGWTTAEDGGQELTIPLPRHRTMRLHLPADVTPNDTRLAKRLISSYLNELPAPRDDEGRA